MAVGDDPSAEIELDHLYEELEEMDPSTFEVRAQRAFPACHVLTPLSGEGRCDPPRSRLHAADDGETDEGHVWWMEDACRARARSVHQAPSPPPRRADQPSRSRRRRLARSIPLHLQPHPRHHLALARLHGRRLHEYHGPDAEEEARLLRW